MQNYDIILIQEHWLPAYDKQDLQLACPGWRNQCICVEEDQEEVEQGKRQTNYGGVATLWKPHMNSYISEACDKESSSRILITTINFPINPICLINCYLPSGSSKKAMENFTEDIDKLHAVVNQFSDTHEIIIMGDLNQDHYNRDSKKEKLVRQLIEQHDLVDLGENCKHACTYNNPHLGQQSHIDHAFIKKRYRGIKWEPIKLGEDCIHMNTSYHRPLEVTVNVPITSRKKAKKKQREANNKLRFKRTETDIEAFRSSLDSEILQIKLDIMDTDAAIQAFQSIVKTAMIDSTPFTRVRNRDPSRTNKQWSPELAEAVKESKLAHFRWKASGRPKGEHHTWFMKKKATRAVRAVQRRQHAAERNAILREIDDAAENDSLLFHKLIKKKKASSISSNTIMIEGKAVEDTSEIVAAWADNYEELATPRETSTHPCDEDVDLIRLLTARDKHNQHVSMDMLENIIKNLRKRKAADLEGLYAEQLQMLTPSAMHVLLGIINKILQQRSIPRSLKKAYKLPIPKKGKDVRIQDNYRGITVAPIILKVLEEICLKLELESLIHKETNDLQFGFSTGRSPSMASLLITEAIAEARDCKLPLYVASLDARKAFDVVNQQLLKKKLNNLGLSNGLWQIVDSMYLDSQEVIRWEGNFSRPYIVQQGVKQGGILSPSLYKIYINNLLNSLQECNLGSVIGSIYIGSPTCADDVLLLSNNKHELQAMLDTANKYSQTHSYQIHPQKTVITTLVEKKSITAYDEDHEWVLGANKVTTAPTFVHLGLKWNEGKRAPDIAANIQSARRRAYSMMRVGLHGIEGLGPATSFKIIKIYIIPCLLHGLEATILSSKDLACMEKYYKGLLRQIQALPENTASEAIYLLLGAIPVQAIYHIKVMTLFGSICCLPQTHALQLLCKRQLAMDNSKNSWINLVTSIGEKYNIDIHKQMQFPWPKQAWKIYIKNTITEQNREYLLSSAADKSSLKWMIMEDHNLNKVHPIWQLAGCNSTFLQSAHTRVKMLTGRYKTQSVLKKYQLQDSSLCHLCGLEEEDTLHMITGCSKTAHLRNNVLKELSQLLRDEGKPEPTTALEKCSLLLNGYTFRAIDSITDTITTISIRPENRYRANQLANKFVHRLDIFRNSFNIEVTTPHGGSPEP